MTLEEFLAWERQQDLRYEFDGIQPVAMTGGTVAHSVIASNVFQALDARLRDPCRVFRGDLKVIAQSQVRYPDTIVTCAPVADDADVVPEPVVLFEVLSASTRVVDQTLKAAEYLATASVQHYVMLEQRRAEAIVLSRTTDGSQQVEVSGVDAVLRLPALGIEVPMAELYRRVQLLT